MSLDPCPGAGLPGGDEAGLVARAAAGDRQAFASLVRRHQSRVRQQLRRLCGGDTALADDLAQEVFLQAWLALPGFRGAASLATWLYRLAYTRCLMHWRSQGRRVQTVPWPDDEPTDPPAAPRAWGPTPHQACTAGLRLDLQRAIDALPLPERLALIHCAHLDLTHEEAAEVLGWPLGTVKSHLSRGKARLRRWLSDGPGPTLEGTP